MNMLIAEHSISSLTKGYDSGGSKHSKVSTDGDTWYPNACQFLKLDHHHIHSSILHMKKSIIERTMQYIKDRTKSFDNYFSRSKENCKLKYVQNWLTLFLSMHNKEVINT
jgi:putative transposase